MARPRIEIRSGEGAPSTEIITAPPNVFSSELVVNERVWGLRVVQLRSFDGNSSLLISVHGDRCSVVRWCRSSCGDQLVIQANYCGQRNRAAKAHLPKANGGGVSRVRGTQLIAGRGSGRKSVEAQPQSRVGVRRREEPACRPESAAAAMYANLSCDVNLNGSRRI
jgi:hypothetical protein